jgi:hypothetical protein
MSGVGIGYPQGGLRVEIPTSRLPQILAVLVHYCQIITQSARPARDINGNDTCNVSITPLKLRPSKTARVAFVHTSIHNPGCQCTKCKLEGSAILSAAEVFMSIEGCHRAKCILTPKDFWEGAGSCHDTSVDLRLFPAKKSTLIYRNQCVTSTPSTIPWQHYHRVSTPAANSDWTKLEVSLYKMMAKSTLKRVNFQKKQKWSIKEHLAIDQTNVFNLDQNNCPTKKIMYGTTARNIFYLKNRLFKQIPTDNKIESFKTKRTDNAKSQKNDQTIH